MIMTTQQIENFWEKVEKTDSCWNWKAYKAFGYGKVNINGEAYPSHRVSVLLSGRDIQLRKKERGAGGVIVMHTCDNRACVNPEHLVVATQKENMRDALRKGRRVSPIWSGVKNPKAKLSKSDIENIKKSKESVVKLSHMYNVHKTTIYSIIRNKSWNLAY